MSDPRGRGRPTNASKGLPLKPQPKRDQRVSSKAFRDRQRGGPPTPLSRSGVLNRSPARSKVNLLVALSLRAKSVSNADIARIMHVSPQTVTNAFKRVGDLALTKREETAVDEMRVSLWKGAEFKLLRTALEDGKLKKAPLAALMMGAGISFDKVRILEGKSTANVFHGVVLDLQRQALDQAIKTNPPKPEEADILPDESDITVAQSTAVSVDRTDEESGS